MDSCLRVARRSFHGIFHRATEAVKQTMICKSMSVDIVIVENKWGFEIRVSSTEFVFSW